jgi:hypothetical protein
MASHGSWGIRFSQTINSFGLYQLHMQKPERLPLLFVSLFALHFNQLSISFSVGRLSSLQAIHPFTHPSTDLQTLHPSISPSKSLDQTPKPSAHSPSHHLHTRTSLPADGVQAQPDVVHSTQVAGGQGNVHSAAVAAAAAAVAADRTDAACTG